MSDGHGLGRAGEDAAADYLVAKGYTIVTRRWRGSGGEIDIVALDGDTLVFVEVKTRTTTSSIALEAIDNAKTNAIFAASDDYIDRIGGDGRIVRYDIITISRQGTFHLVDAFRP